MLYESMVYRISPTLKRITRKLNGHHRFFDENDLYQEALAHLWTNFTKGKMDDKTDSYILQGCYFHLKNYLRTVKENAQILSLSDPVDGNGTTLEDCLVPDDSDSVETIIDRLDVEKFEKDYLTQKEKVVLELFCEGMSTREIGAKLGISHMMVWKIKNRIREKYSRFRTEAAHPG